MISSAGDEKDKDNNWEFYAHKIHQPGYDRIDFLYNKMIFSNVKEAFKQIKKEISDELGLFYKINQSEIVRWFKFDELNEILDNIINIQKKEGFKGLIYKYFFKQNILIKLLYN